MGSAKKNKAMIIEPIAPTRMIDLMDSSNDSVDVEDGGVTEIVTPFTAIHALPSPSIAYYDPFEAEDDDVDGPGPGSRSGGDGFDKEIGRGWEDADAFRGEVE